jgi:chromosome segregation ATPase
MKKTTKNMITISVVILLLFIATLVCIYFNNKSPKYSSDDELEYVDDTITEQFGRRGRRRRRGSGGAHRLKKLQVKLGELNALIGPLEEKERNANTTINTENAQINNYNSQIPILNSQIASLQTQLDNVKYGIKQSVKKVSESQTQLKNNRLINLRAERSRVSNAITLLQ